ncbi:MAG: DinB family protein [Pyrinomonadaceae bacterium]
MQHDNQLTSDCVQALKQGVALIEKLDDSLYTETRWLPVKSGVGGHVRHCLDFYQSFLAGVASGRIDYNRREREVLIERDRAFAVTKLRIVIAELQALPDADGDAPLLVTREGVTDTVEPSAWCRSSISRELQFLLSHTVHHYALVALLLRLQGFEPVAEFGVTPSTLRHWKREAVCAQ